MLNEIAITPHAFSEEIHGCEELFRGLEFLGSQLRSSSLSKSICISGLDSVPGFCGWENSILMEIGEISDEKTRVLAERVFEVLSKLVVHRNSTDTQPETETQWLNEICRSHQQDYPIDKVILSANGDCPCEIPSHVITCLVSNGCFDNIDPTRSISGDFDEQISNLNHVIRHSEFIDVVVPRISDLNDGSVEAIANTAANLPTFSGNPRLFTIHCEISEDGNRDTASDGVKQKLSKYAGKLDVVLKLWDYRSLSIERLMIGGSLDREISGCRGARWGVHLSHLPTKGERVGRESFRRWSLVDARTAQQNLRQLHDSKEAKRVQKIRIID